MNIMSQLIISFLVGCSMSLQQCNENSGDQLKSSLMLPKKNH